MITKELIERINYLARKSRETGLTEDELSEQAMVRRQYLDAIKARVQDTLDHTKIVREGSENTSCTCGCHHGPDEHCHKH